MQSHRRGHDREENGQPDLSSRQRAVDDTVLQRTARLFEKRTNRTLSKEDARQIVENLTGFFQTLAEWDRAERPRQTKSARPEGEAG